MLNIVLLEPEIPYNTGAIGRTCVAAGARLHLIEPLGFVISDRYLRRAGMDYWQHLDVTRYIGFADFLEKNPLIGEGKSRLLLATTKARRTYADIAFGPDDYILFGKESAGIPEELLKEREADCIRIPMAEGTRSLNLSVSAAVILYEAMRQNGFMDLERQGNLHRLSWDN